MKGSVNNNKKSEQRCILVKEIAHFLLFWKPTAFLVSGENTVCKMQEMGFPSELHLICLIFPSYQFKFIVV